MAALLHESSLRKFGLKVQFFRTQRKMTQQALADKLGIDQQQIGRIERGEVNSSLQRVFALADALGLQNAMGFFDFTDIFES